MHMCVCVYVCIYIYTHIHMYIGDEIHGHLFRAGRRGAQTVHPFASKRYRPLFF